MYVKRIFKNSGVESSKQIFLDDVLSSIEERNRFINKYEQIAPVKNKERIRSFINKTPGECEVVDFSLTAFETDYSVQTLSNYLENYLKRLPFNQLQFAGFASIIYYYTQKSVPSALFHKLFPEGNLEIELSQRPIDEHYIKKLFIQEFNIMTLEYEDSWRPRYNRFAKELISCIICPDGNWKDYLAKWSIDLIDFLKSDYLTDDVNDLLKSLFLLRDHEDVIGFDEEYQYNATARKFSRLIEHISDKKQQLTVFRKLAETYPEAPHYHGHLGRFLFENAVDPKDFEWAEIEISKALDLGDTDYNLWHLKGMCHRRRIEFLLRTFDADHYSSDENKEFEGIIKSLTVEAVEDFTKSREINPMNLHSHTSEIQLLLKVVSFGLKLSNSTADVFFAESSNSWYENLVNTVFELLDEAKYIIDQSKDLDYLKERGKSINMISNSEGRLFSVLGDFSKAVDRFMHLSTNAERQFRPYYRKMYVYSVLNSKSNGLSSSFERSWGKLSDYEFDNIIRMLEANISEQPEDPHNMKLWFKAIRNVERPYNIEDCLSVVKTWYDNTRNNKIAHLEASYYRYILHAINAINGGSAFNVLDVEQAKYFIEESKNLTENDMFSFEWYSNKKGIQALISHSSLGPMNSEDGFFCDASKAKLGMIEGVITNIYNRQKGKIKLECGLDAFFVPAKGNFHKGEETKKVKFFISFRYSGLHAWEVLRVEDTEFVYKTSSDKEIEGYTLEEENVFREETEKSIEEKEPIFNVEEYEVFDIKHKLEGPTIIGKIDLSQFEKFKKK
ncbi:MAG: hypothetical protein Q8867_10180 [Bacteroidota bacterium]|nr:hypothetical protein [Bacteroidota bacterium]